MMRLCLLGNSHLAAFKTGWEEIQARHPDCELTFFGAVRKKMNRLRLDESAGRLVPSVDDLGESLAMTSGGRTEIVAADYDAFVFCGMNFSFRELMPLYKSFRSDELAASEDGDVQLISADCFRESARLLLADTVSVRLASMTRKITDRPIFLVPQPLPCEDIRNTKGDRNAAWRWMLASGDDARMDALFMDLVREPFVEGAVVVPQPGETRTGTVLTRREYSLGSIRLRGVEHPEGDLFHMNAKFGAAVLEDLLRSIAVPPA